MHRSRRMKGRLTMPSIVLGMPSVRTVYRSFSRPLEVDPACGESCSIRLRLSEEAMAWTMKDSGNVAPRPQL